jgi:hypothetical protein
MMMVLNVDSLAQTMIGHFHLSGLLRYQNAILSMPLSSWEHT